MHEVLDAIRRDDLLPALTYVSSLDDFLLHLFVNHVLYAAGPKRTDRFWSSADRLWNSISIGRISSDCYCLTRSLSLVISPYRPWQQARHP
jgi:hypothetical protein